ncbi:MAG: TIGR03564 family F420-dependent LLM class oxidoreductase [Candidatus Dormibacteraceae bacterium]
MSLTTIRGENNVEAAIVAAQEAVDAGLSDVWFGQRFDTDAIGLAGIVGRAIPGLHIGVAAVPIFARHPILISSQAQTSQAATGGRFRLGLALGAPALIEPVFGMPYQRPVALLREFLTALNPLLQTGTVDFHGELITATTPMSAAVAGAAPSVPVLVAAMGPQALRATGELATGVLPRLAGPGVLARRIVPTVTAAAERAGRPAPEIVAIVPVAVSADPDHARRTARERLAFYETIPSYRRVLDEEGVERAGDLAIIGDEDTIGAGLQRYLDAGATEIIATETDLGGPAERLRTWQALGQLTN